MNRIHTINLAIALAFTSTWVSAAPEDAPESNASCQLRVATGKKGKGYSRLFADIRNVCGAQVSLCEIETEGGLQNATTLAANQAEVGFVQLDTLQDLKDTDEGIASLATVMPLNSNLLHVVARSEGYSPETGTKFSRLFSGKVGNVEINKFSDLEGLPVALVGSAKSLARALEKANRMNLRFIDVDTDEQALAMVKGGGVAAMFSTSGWPSGPVSHLKRGGGLKLVEYDMRAPAPYQVTSRNYENLGAFRVPFLTSPNLLVSRPFKSGGASARAVATLQGCLQKNLGNLQDGRYEPAWSEVKNVGESYGWARFGGVASKK